MDSAEKSRSVLLLQILLHEGEERLVKKRIIGRYTATVKVQENDGNEKNLSEEKDEECPPVLFKDK